MNRATDISSEVTELRRAYSTVPGPPLDTAWRARDQVRIQAPPARPLPYRPSRGLVTAGALAGCVAVATLTAVVVSSSTPGPASHSAPVAGAIGASSAKGGPALTLTALTSTINSAMASNHAIQFSTQTEHTAAGVQTINMWQSDAGNGGSYRLQSLGKSGRLLSDLAMRPGGKPGETQSIEYVGVVNEYAEWSFIPPPNPRKAALPHPSTPPPAAGKDWLRARLASGDVTLVGPVTLHGTAAILLNTTEGATSDPAYKHGQLWIDTTTYLPLRLTVTMKGQTSVIDYRYLAGTPANNAQLWITPGPSWKKVSSADLPRDLVS